MELSGIGKDVRALGHTILQVPSVLGHLQQRREETEFERAKLGLFKGTFQFQKSLSTRQDYEQWEEDWQHTHESLYEQISEDIKTEGARNAFEMLYMSTVEKVSGNIGKVASQKIEQTSIADAGYRIDEYARLGNVKEVQHQFAQLRKQGILKIGNTDIGRLQYAKEQEAYASQVRGQLETIALEQGADAALAWITNPASKKESAALTALDADHQKEIFNEVENKAVRWRIEGEKKKTLAEQEGQKKLMADWESGAFDGDFKKYTLSPSVRASMQKKWKNEKEAVEYNFWKKTVEGVVEEDIPELRAALETMPEDKLSIEKRDSLIKKLDTISTDREYERLDKEIAAATTVDELKVLDKEIRDIPLEKLNRTDKKHFHSRLAAKQKDLQGVELNPEEEQARIDESEAWRLFRAGKLTPQRLMQFDTFNEQDIDRWNGRLDSQKEESKIEPAAEQSVINMYYDRRYSEAQVAEKIASLNAEGLISNARATTYLERLDNRQAHFDRLDPAAAAALNDIDILTKDEELEGQESAQFKILLSEFLMSEEYQALDPMGKSERLEVVTEQIEKEATKNFYTKRIKKLSENRWGQTPEEQVAEWGTLAENIRKPLMKKVWLDIRADFEATEFGVPTERGRILSNGMYVLIDSKGVFYRRERQRKRNVWFRGTIRRDGSIGWDEMR